MNNYIKVSTSYIQPISYALILAVDSRGGIGLKNDLPWKGFVDNKSDMQWFRDKTKGKIVVMGYNTWVSIGCKPLPGRINIVLTKDHVYNVAEDIDRFNFAFLSDPKNNDKKPPIVKTASTPADVCKFIKDQIGTIHQGGEVMVMGGAKIYEAFAEYTSRIYLTTFRGEFEADTFVNLNLDQWDLLYRDAMTYLGPVFEIWDCTEEAAKRPDSETIQINHVHKPAQGLVKYTIEGK